MSRGTGATSAGGDSVVWYGVDTCDQNLYGCVAAPSCLEQKPDPLFSLVDPHLEQACCSDVAILVAQFVYLAHPCSELHVVFAQLREHAVRRHVLAVVVGHALQARNVADEWSVVPPILRTRSATASVTAKISLA